MATHAPGRPLYQRPSCWPIASDEAIIRTLFLCDTDWRLQPGSSQGRSEPVMMGHFMRWVIAHRARAAFAFLWLKRHQDDVTPDGELFRLLFHPPSHGFRDWVRENRPEVWAIFRICQDIQIENTCPTCGQGDQILVCDIQGSYCQRCGGKTWITP